MLYVSATPILFFMTLTSGAWRDYPLLGWLTHREVNSREVKIWMYFAINLEPMSSAPPFMGLSQSRHPLYFVCTHTVCIFSSVHAHFLAQLCIYSWVPKRKEHNHHPQASSHQHECLSALVGCNLEPWLCLLSGTLSWCFFPSLCI